MLQVSHQLADFARHMKEAARTPGQFPVPFYPGKQRCKNCTTPTNRREWWLAKLNGNAARDKLHQAALRKLTLGTGRRCFRRHR